MKRREKRKQERADDEEARRLKVVADKFYDSEAMQKERTDMKRYLKRFKGKWWSDAELRDTEADLYANFAFSTVMTTVPLITDNKAIWSARARKFHLQDIVEQYKLAGEYLHDKEGVEMKDYETLLSASIMRKGIQKIYWNPDGEDGIGEVAIDVVDPRTFFTAPGYSDLYDSPCMGTKERKAISWIREHFPEKGKQVKPDELEGAENFDDKTEYELHDEFVGFYTMWFRDSEMEEYFLTEASDEITKEEVKSETRKKYPYGRIVYFTSGVLLGDHKCQYRTGTPYIDIDMYKVPFEFWGKGEIDHIEALNESYNEKLRLLHRYTKNYCDAPWLVDANAGLDFDVIKKQLIEGGAAFEVNFNMSENPIRKVDIKPINSTILNAMGIETKIIEEVSGVTDITKGMAIKKQEQSATEISTLIESSYTRTRQKVRVYEDFKRRQWHHILTMMQQFYSEPRRFSYKSPDMSGGVSWNSIQNTPDFWEEKLKPGEPPGEFAEPEEAAEYEERQAIYEQFVEEFGDEDEVFAAFDIEIQTNSTLPTDQQSLANLFLRLLQMAAGNPVTAMPMWAAALENLRIPNHKEITEAMNTLFAKEMQSKGPPQGMSPGMPQGGPQ